MWVFIERIGDLYVGIAHDDVGGLLLEITTPLTDTEIHERFAAFAEYGDCSDVDCALYDADEAAEGRRETERRFFHLIRVRAMAGRSSPSDCEYVVEQLHDPSPAHDIRSLLWTIGHMGARYEDVVVPFLDYPNTNREAEYAMDALIRMGLLDKYVDLFIAWMRGAGPPNHSPFGSTVYGMAPHAFVRSQNPRILSALIDASRDPREKWTTREHALGCLAIAIDLENAPLGERLPLRHPYFSELLRKADALLAKLRTT